jgi:hypothetical protein
LLIAIVGGALWWFARGGPAAPGRREALGDARPPEATGPKGEAMVRCEYCDTHVPQSSAVFAGTHGFCCDAHRAAAGY